LLYDLFEIYTLSGLSVYKKGHSYRETCRVFDISLSSLQCWLKAITLEPKRGYTRRHKIDADALIQHVKDHPQMYLRERAESEKPLKFKKYANFYRTALCPQGVFHTTIYHFLLF